MLRPYTARILASEDRENPVHVVRHDDERVEPYSGEVFWDRAPASFCAPACSIELHAVDGGSTEGATAGVSRPDRYEVRARSRIVESAEPA